VRNIIGSVVQLNKNRKYFFDQRFFSIIDSEIKAYWLGFIIADGSIRLSNLRGDVRLTVHNKDAYHLNKFSNAIKYTGNLYRHPNEASTTLNLYSRLMARDLILLGVMPNKTGHESFPEINGPLYRHLVRGIFDGDGTIGCYNNSWALSFCSGSYVLLSNIKFFINNVLHNTKGGINSITGRNAYRLNFGGTIIAPLVGNLLYNDANRYLDRKYNIYKEMVSYESK
jgi:hypothetical protein